MIVLLISITLVTVLDIITFYSNVKQVVDITSFPTKQPSLSSYLMQAQLSYDRNDTILVKVESKNQVMPFSVIAKEGDTISFDSDGIHVNHFQIYPVIAKYSNNTNHDKTLGKGEYYILWKSTNNDAYGACIRFDSMLDYLKLPVVTDYAISSL